MHFPLFVDLTDRPCLVVGAGSVAARKVRVLADFGARVMVVAPDAKEETTPGACAWRARPFCDDDVSGQTLVVAATDDAALNARVSELCRARRIPVNVVDEPALCTFIFPSIARQGPLVAAVSSGGVCPVATQLVRDRVAEVMTEALGRKALELGARREELKASLPDAAKRREWMRKELESC